MSPYQIYNIFSGICIGALIMTWIGFCIYLRQERRHRAELNRLQRNRKAIRRHFDPKR